MNESKKRVATIRMDEELYLKAQTLAWKQHKSLNQFCVDAVGCLCMLLETERSQNLPVTPRSLGIQDE